MEILMRQSISLYASIFCLFVLLNSCSNETSKTPDSTEVFEDSRSSKPKLICKNNQNAVTEINKPYVIMISIDGFRADYIQKYKPKNLLKIMNHGIYTSHLIPSYPTLTFPNHYTLATGRYPGHHGIVSNSFYDTARKEVYNAFNATSSDGTWYQGDPLWNVAERAGMVSYTLDWVGSAAHINNMDPTCYTNYNGAVTFAEKVNTAIQSLELSDSARPHFITLYTAAVDDAGHATGTDSVELKKSIEETDSELGRLWDYVQKSDLPINLVIVSDHGMVNTDINKIIYLKDIIADFDDTYKISDKGGAPMIYQEDPVKLKAAYEALKNNEVNFKAYLKDEAPADFHIDHPSRTGDIIIIPDIPYYVQTFRPVQGVKPTLKAGNHGWSPENKEMHTLFVAAGANIKKNKIVPAFKNVDVYPFVLKILSLKSTIPNDGDLDTLKRYILK
jgi:predicted AlkP superfamily pyrophosphatase or phosphodiesterase